jgi:hypothetical protein
MHTMTTFQRFVLGFVGGAVASYAFPKSTRAIWAGLAMFLGWPIGVLGMYNYPSAVYWTAEGIWLIAVVTAIRLIRRTRNAARVQAILDAEGREWSPR